MMNITGNSSTQTAGYIPENDVAQKKMVLPDNIVNPEIVRLVVENQHSQQNAVTGKTAEEIIRPFSQHVIPSLLSDYDKKRMSAVIELCNVLLLDAVNQQERRDTLEKLAMQQATLLKDLKYQEADYQVVAAVVGAMVSVTVAVIGGSMAINGINTANPGVLTAQSIAGQAISGLSQSLGQLGSQPFVAMGTRLQGEGEVVRALKDVLLNSMSVHNKVSDDQKAFQKKLLEILVSEFENRKNTAQNLINNMKG
ncbi:hypothetical protein [Morganella morganii]|uniref:Uncharacterized protein n=2 Tax=Morganella morganii TaxID=582 RepID=A0A9Q4CMI7_MORMO|nr:hypothetical protein [Morganella morganii]HDS6843521.1 hypothetical protein [Morganella morganii subsp. morganii]HDU8308362.1 hypothetical protein [Morganella morganii subsp. sibonii]EGT3630767.1 hypothetical protein [Morganella morganii]EKK5376054.1 hypothetical protein [Morganella morganii]EKW7746250.1 hypothetical protein [Morganella morganii]